MRKYVLMVLFLVAAFVANGYFSTGELPYLGGGEIPEDIRHVRDLKVEYLETVERYYAAVDQSSLSFGLDEKGAPEWALVQVEKIEKELETIRPELESEIAKAEAGWLRMKLRRFKKRLDVAEVDES